jgi:hypothetical protein
MVMYSWPFTHAKYRKEWEHLPDDHADKMDVQALNALIQATFETRRQ